MSGWLVETGSCASWSAINRRGATARRAACGAGYPRSPRNSSGFDRGSHRALLTTPAPLTTLARQPLRAAPWRHGSASWSDWITLADL
jgi:hypothetical protein